MKTINKYNLLLFIPLLILNIISLFNMLNAKVINAVYNYAFYKQLIWFTLGYLIIFISSKINFKNLFKYSFYIYLFSIILLVLVLFLGTSTNGAKCWFSIFGLSFQPSELTKLSLALLFTNIIKNAHLKSFKDEVIILLKLIILTLIPSILVFLEPDTGAIINFLIILLVAILFLHLNKWWYITFTFLIILLLSGFFIMYFYFQDTLIKIIGTSFFYRMERLINFTNGSGYQLENALINIGAASFFRFNLKDILLYIPEAPTDFILAFAIGNYGLISGIVIIFCYLLIDIYLIYKISHSKNRALKFFSYSYLGIFLFHQIYNISMNLGLLPIMGIPLPFLSYGGTNTLINYLFLGIILNLFQNKRRSLTL